MKRREFIKITSSISSALIIGINIPTKSKASENKIQKDDLKPNAFIKIDKDNTITFLMGQAEMGQGAYTSLAMCLAEELEVKWEDINFEASPVDKVYYHAWVPLMLTGGSTTVSTLQENMRKVGATVNIMLKNAAAKRWQIRSFNVKTKNSIVINKKTNETFTYGDLISDLYSIKVPSDPKLKEFKDCKIIGKPTRRHPKEAWAKVTGKAEFGIDVRVDNMKYAAIVHPTIFGAKVKSFDAKVALSKPGVLKVKEIPTGIAVIAEQWWIAKEALYDINVIWENDDFKKVSTDILHKEYKALTNKDGNVMREDGNIKEAFESAKNIIEAEYNFPFLAHAPMEPLNCLVHDKKDSAEIWSGGQIQSVYRDVCSQILGIKANKVKYHNTFLGGGFGRRAAANVDYVAEAVHVSKGESYPVMTLWTREDDIKMGNYRPMYKNKARLALDEKGKITGFEASVVGQNIVKNTPLDFLIKNGVDWAQWEGLSNHPYNIESHKLQAHSPESPIPVLWWRSVGHTQSAPMIEGLIEIAANEAGVDPIEYRINMLDNKRYVNLLNEVARLSNWANRKKEKGVGYGVSFVPSFGSVIAQIAKVRVSDDDYKVEKVWCSVDCGFAFNPLNVENQMISGINFGLSAVKHSNITIENGATVQSNFYDYEVARISDVPDIEVSILNSGDKIGGIGEPGTPPIFAAVANALFDATGKRYTSFPIKNLG